MSKKTYWCLLYFLEYHSREIKVAAVESVVNNRSLRTLQDVIKELMKDYSASVSASVAVKTICDRYLEENSVSNLAKLARFKK